MKRKVFKWSLLVGIGSMAFCVTACNGSEYATAQVRLSATSLELSVGDVSKLTVSHTKGFDAELRWFTSDHNVAYAEGSYVYAIGEGTATITAAYGGGYADCVVTVGEGGGTTTEPTIVLSKTKVTVEVGSSAMFEVARIYPEDATFTVENSNTSVVEMTQAEKQITVKGLAEGEARITVTGSNGIIKACTVSVVKQGGGDEPADAGDIAVDKNLNYSGSLNIGSPANQRTFMEGLLADFNKFTGSNIKFTVIDFEESNGTSGYNNAKSMPAVFPYASDQTMDLSQFNALSKLPNSDIKWIKTNMGDTAADAATYGPGVVGYPFAADNGLVMFYQKSAMQAYLTENNITTDVQEYMENITIDKLLEVADELGYEVNYPLGNGFYGAPALMTYSPGHKSLYTLTSSSSGYKSTATFNSEVGKKGAKLVHDIAVHPVIRNATDAPRKDVLATITDSSKVKDFKFQMGNDYAAAPLPYVTDAENTRIGSFLGYKFYGVNMQLEAKEKEMACSVAKFLVSKYVQTQRFNTYNVRPTLNSLAELARSEAHVAALEKQANNGSIALKAVSLALWSNAQTAFTQIKADKTGDYTAILAEMDSQLNIG